MASWKYCGKEESRLEGPLESGVPPASLRVKGDKGERNKLIIEKGLTWAVENGHIPIEKYL